MKKILLVAGARPNFMKIAPILRAVENRENLEAILVHTGQHYDENMSMSFFSSLGIKKSDYNLAVGSGSHAVQTANIMMRFEEVCLREMPDVVVVVGDVNSTIAAGLVAKKLHIQLAHVEAGLRSRDRKMPEEINRLATDAITDIFFTTEKEGTQNLLNEGHSSESIHFVGHVMIDNLYYQLEKTKDLHPSPFVERIKKNLPEKYLCMTLHRPSNVDHKDDLSRFLTAINEIAKDIPVIFPCHPRTRKQIDSVGLNFLFKEANDYSNELISGLYLMEPLGYNDFLYLWKDAAAVLTDSGGLQEETTALKIPCITMRENTERPVTVEVGTNILVGQDVDQLKMEVSRILTGQVKNGSIPPLWDGKASERIVGIILKNIDGG